MRHCNQQGRQVPLSKGHSKFGDFIRSAWPGLCCLGPHFTRVLSIIDKAASCPSPGRVTVLAVSCASPKKAAASLSFLITESCCQCSSASLPRLQAAFACAMSYHQSATESLQSASQALQASLVQVRQQLRQLDTDTTQQRSSNVRPFSLLRTASAQSTPVSLLT